MEELKEINEKFTKAMNSDVSVFEKRVKLRRLGFSTIEIELILKH